MKNKKIGIYAICKNEIKKISSFIEKHIEADLIAILDTGSTDGTYEVLKKLEEEKENLIVKQEILNPFRFDVARNLSYQMIPQEIDIAFSIDIDEYAEENWKEIILNNWDDNQERYWYDWEQLNYKNLLWNKSYLHKNNKKFKWYYPVHEMIGTIDSEPVGLPKETFPKMPLKIFHYQEIENHPREELYIELLEKRIAEVKEDIYGKTMLAFSYYNNFNNIHAALKLGKEALLEKVSGYYEKHHALEYIKKGIATWYNELGLEKYYKKKNYKKALKFFKKAYINNPKELYKQNIEFAQKEIKKIKNKSKDKKYKISVYTITKNEEKFVEEWVENMSEADEIVVLDTGSTDNTVKKLKELGVKVKTKIINPWRFDVARNESMKLISPEMDICISTDLDERFEKGWANAIRENWNDKADRGKYLYTWNHDSFGNPKTQIWYQKIHKNDGNWKWEMPVHEILKSKDPFKKSNWIHLPQDKVHLHHYPDTTKSRGSYIELMKKSVEENPNNFLQNYYLGRELYFYSRWNESIEQFLKTISMLEAKNSKPYIAASYSFIGRCYEELEEFNKAEANYLLALDYVNGVREPYIKLMEFYYRQKRWCSLIDIGLKTLKVKENLYEWYEDSRNYKEIPHDYLSLAYYNTGNFQKGIEHIDKAIKFNPNEDRYIRNKAFFLKALNK